jgi:uncharacterized protein YgiM (DUF1202 family)
MILISSGWLAGIFGNYYLKSFATGSMVTVIDGRIWSEPDRASNIVKTIREGEKVTIIGETVIRETKRFAPVEHEGDKGYIEVNSIRK